MPLRKSSYKEEACGSGSGLYVNTVSVAAWFGLEYSVFRLPMDERLDRMERELTDEPPPIFGVWRYVYGAVLAFLLALIVFFWAFGRVFTP